MDRPLVVIAGPTGSGKSELSLRVAERFHGEIVNCDSIQIYRYFDIGSAKLPVSERRGIPHHLIDIAEPAEVFTAGDYARVARPVLREISERGNLPVVVGGTGFYLRALIEGLAPGPQRNEALRERLRVRETRRPGSLHQLLRRFDPATAARIHANDTPKLMRALEICLSARQPATEVFSAGRDRLEGFRVLKLGLFPPREELYRRLEARMEKMFEAGLLVETAAIAKRTGFLVKPFESIGYSQALGVVKGELSMGDAISCARRDTRRYAKRQMTWFRREPGLKVVNGFGDEPEVIAQVEARVGEFLDASATNPVSLKA